MDRILASVAMTTRSIGWKMANDEREKREHLTFREAAARVIVQNRIVKGWKGLVDVSTSGPALARDVSSQLIAVLLSQPFASVASAAMMSGLVTGVHSDNFQGYRSALTRHLDRFGYAALFHGWLPSYLSEFVQECKPSIRNNGVEEYDDHDIAWLERTSVRTLLHITAYTLSHPLMVVGARMSFYGPEVYPSALATVSTMIKDEGYASLYKGFSITAVKCLIGLMYGTDVEVATNVLYPVELIQLYMMLQKGDVESPWTTADRIYSTKGWKGFFSGFGAMGWLIPWYCGVLAIAEATALTVFGFKKHNSERTVPQRMRTALRRMFEGETVAERQARKQAEARAIAASQAKKDAKKSE